MSIKTFIVVIITILSASSMHVAAVDVLEISRDINSERTVSWSERRDVSAAIVAYREEIDKLEDLFVTCESAWRKTPDIDVGQPFIGDKKAGEHGFIHNAPNARFMHIQDIQKYLKRLKCGIDLLNSVKMREKDIGVLSAKKSVSLASFLKLIHLIDGMPITECLYRKVNGNNEICANGMRAYGMSFSTVIKPEWNGENALTRFGKIIGMPGSTKKGSLQKALEALLLTIDIKIS